MNNIRVKNIIYEDFINYKYPSMFIALGECDWKCCIEQNVDISICQNCELSKQNDIEMSIIDIFNDYISNNITSSITIGGLESFKRFDEIFELIKYFRIDGKINDTFVIFTGYYPEEIVLEVELLKQFKNIIIKFGRYIPNKDKKYDDILGIYLASDNQYAIKIS